MKKHCFVCVFLVLVEVNIVAYDFHFLLKPCTYRAYAPHFFHNVHHPLVYCSFSQRIQYVKKKLDSRSICMPSLIMPLTCSIRWFIGVVTRTKFVQYVDNLLLNVYDFIVVFELYSQILSK